MSILDENDNGIVDADKAGKALLAADEYDKTSMSTSGCSCRGIAVGVFVVSLALMVIATIFGS